MHRRRSARSSTRRAARSSGRTAPRSSAPSASRSTAAASATPTRPDSRRRARRRFFPRLRDNLRILREAHRYIGQQATTGYDVSPAAEWLLDNFHLIEAQLREIADGLPRRYFRDLPVLQEEPLVGLPRVYGVAWAFVAHTDSAFDEELLVHFLQAYQEARELTLGELWALPTTLRVVLIENLRRLAERVAANKAAREVANLCADRLEAYPPERLDAVLALLNRRAVGETFLAQIAQRLQDPRTDAERAALDWVRRVAPHLAEIQTRLPAAQAADNLSTGNAITSLRSIGDADWPDIVGQTSVLMQMMLRSPAFAAERDDTRDRALHAVEKLARKSGRSERSVAATLVELMQGADEPHDAGDDDPKSVAAYWLLGPGQDRMLAALGLRATHAWRRRARLRRIALPVYLGAVALATGTIVAWLLLRHSAALAPDVPAWLGVLAAC
jgi:cyclic beta-1,2-glucan synthetase